jgi:hypothetical protein
MEIECIVKNEKYELSSFEHGNKPENIVRLLGKHILSNGVIPKKKVTLIGSSDKLMLYFYYKGFNIHTSHTKRIFVSDLNRINEMSEVELEKLLFKGYKNAKKSLEKELVALKTQKKELNEKLIEKLDIYLDVKEKKEETKRIIKKLES